MSSKQYDFVAPFFPQHAACFQHNQMKHVVEDFIGGKKGKNIASGVNFLATAIQKQESITNQKLQEFVRSFFGAMKTHERHFGLNSDRFNQLKATFERNVTEYTKVQADMQNAAHIDAARKEAQRHEETAAAAIIARKQMEAIAEQADVKRKEAEARLKVLENNLKHNDDDRLMDLAIRRPPERTFCPPFVLRQEPNEAIILELRKKADVAEKLQQEAIQHAEAAKARIIQLQRELEEANSIGASLGKEVGSLRETIKKAEEQVKMSEETSQKALARAEMAEGRIKELSGIIHELEESIKTAEEQKKTALQKAEIARLQVLELTCVLKEEISNSTKLSNEVTQLQQAMKKQEGQIKASEEALQAAAQRAEAAQKRVSELEENLQSAQADVTEWQERATQEKNRADAACARLAKANKEIKQLRRDIKSVAANAVSGNIVATRLRPAK